jgi:hypothetical protein
VDIRNGYLHVAGAGEQSDLNVCIFRRPDQTYLAAVNANEDSNGAWKPFLGFYVYRDGHLVDVTRSTLPRPLSKRLGYRLPHYGTTLHVVDEAGQRVYDLLWAGGRFRAQPGGVRPVVPPITPSYVMPRRLYERRDYPSPDGRYIARLRHGDGDVWDLTVVAAGTHRQIAAADDIQDLIWAPGKPHRLVAAACGVYGKALLGMWEGGPHWHSLYAVRRPDEECFTLYGVTRDGRSIVYGHDPDLNASRPGSQNPLDRRRWLRLPP